MDTGAHWDAVYRVKPDDGLSWYQAHPARSLALIESLRPAPQRVLDVGGGQSALGGLLAARGVPEVCVLDISAHAIERARARCGNGAHRIRWMVGDITRIEGLPEVDLWHDRAVFHFLTDGGDRARYRERALSAVRPGGWMIVATFGPEGPEQCSGLPVHRSSAEQLGAEFGPGFGVIDAAEEVHVTPWGKAQQFVYAVMRREG